MARYPKNSTPKLTSELIKELTNTIRTGAYIETASARCGISKDTLYRWLREAKKKDASELLLELSDALDRAFQEVITTNLAIINTAANGIPETFQLNEDGTIECDEFGRPVVAKYKTKPDWRAAAWILERRFPNEWGKNPKRENVLEILPVEQIMSVEQRQLRMKEIDKRLAQLQLIQASEKEQSC